MIKIVLEQSLPYIMSVCGCESRVWYREKLPQCFMCREVGHRAQSCPLSGLCCRCRQLGHRARACTRAWDSVAPSPWDADPVSVPDPTGPEVDPVPAPMPVDPVAPGPVPDPPADGPVSVPSPVDVSDVPVVAPSASYVNAYILALHASKTLSAKFPEFDGANDVEKDSKARAYVKRLIYDTCTAKDLSVKSDDFFRWSPDDIRRFSDEFCFKFGVPSQYRTVVIQCLEYNQSLNSMQLVQQREMKQ